jgi:EAL domain-containing protein (putative c-di-GMP-specific phosphodiesterase class I)
MGETMLDRLLAPGALRVVFQPILQYDQSGWRVHALEALVRGPRGTHMEFPDVLFEYVRRKGAEVAMDRHCLAAVLRGARALGTEITLSVNVHAATLEQDGDFVDFLAEQVQEVGRTPAHVIIEVVEHSPPWAGRGFGRALEQFRERGFPIALDDVGLGQSNFRMILECRPDYFKMDAFLIQGTHTDYYRRAVLRSIVDLAGSFGATAVAEGLDSVEDLRIVLDEGVRVVQGYLLARPVAARVLGSTNLLVHAADRLPVAFDEPVTFGSSDWLSHATKGVLELCGDLHVRTRGCGRLAEPTTTSPALKEKVG